MLSENWPGLFIFAYMNTKYTVIVFDLGNVLIPFNYEIAFAKLDEIKQGLGNHYRTFLKDNYHLHRAHESGQMSDYEFISVHLAALDNLLDRETFCRIYSEIFTVNEPTTDLLSALKQKYRLMLLSNTNAIHKKYGWEHYPWLGNFEKLFLSHEVKAVKPQPEIYNAVTAYTKAPASEHIFIDDIAEYVEGAKKCGWDGIQYLSHEYVVKELEARGILPLN